MKKVLSEVLAGYPGIVTNVSRLKLEAPFEWFVHRWDRFVAAKDDPLIDEITKEHIELFQDIMEQDLGDLIQLRQDYFSNKAVTFEHVWTLFPPGCTVIGNQKGKTVAARFDSGYFGKTPCGPVYFMNCKCIDWDGSIMGWTDVNQQIPMFLGARPFSQLPCFPLEYHEQPELTAETLRERGRRFEELAGYRYKAYKGMALYHPDAQKTLRENVQSRVVIDGVNWENANPGHQVYIYQLQSDDDVPGLRRASCSSGGSCGSDSDSDSDAVAVTGEAKRLPLTEDQLLLTSAITRGYALKNKRWMEFFIDGITEVDFDTRAFSSLVLPQEQKELVLAFAESQVKFKDSFDDVISGKGKGIIMLLSGGPGIGKTLTAESVAEEMKVPLYIMSAGDLGVEADEVDRNLTEILEMVANWNAVLLLDECDVFLEERSAHDIERNRIVSIFLRTLEYYEGILFLTTNRIKHMDPAFQSRIHISLEYPPLDAAARATVWATFLDRTISLDPTLKGKDAHEVSGDEVEALGGLDLNGRQIKNVLKAANLLACHKSERLAFKHLKTVLKVQGHSL